MQDHQRFRLLLAIETLAAALEESRQRHADFVETLRCELNIAEKTIFPDDDVTDKVRAIVAASKRLLEIPHFGNETGAVEELREALGMVKP